MNRMRSIAARILRQLAGAAVWMAGFGSPNPPDSSARRTSRNWPYGRLYRTARVRPVYQHRGALSALVAALLVCASPPSHAATTYTTHAQAMSACQAWATNEETNVAKDAECREGTYTDGRPEVQGWEIIYYISGGVRTSQVYSPWAKRQDYIYTTPINPCDSAPTVSGSLAGKVLQGYSFCTPVTSGGATVMCRMNVSVSGPPTMNQWGSWHTPGSSTSSGSTCDGSTGDGGWKAPNGSTPVPTPPDPTTTPPTNPPPKACGGGSCYDPNNDNFCAVSGGAQICIPGGTARTPSGGCASSGDSTICGGSPTAPPPPADKVPDPSSGLGNVDNYTQADPTTGGNQTVQIINYTNPGGTGSTSGQSAGDSGPPAPGTGDPTGTECTAGQLCHDAFAQAPCGTDPITAGDPLLGAAVKELHKIRCAQAGSDLDTGTFDNGDHSMGEDHDPSEVFVEGGTGTGEDDGQGGLSLLDSGGFLGGPSTCPGIPDVEIGGRNIVAEASLGLCNVMEMFGAMVLAMAYAAGALIIGRSKAGA